MTAAVRSSETMSPAMAYADAYHQWVFSSFAADVGKGTVLEVGSGHGRYARLLAPRVEKLIVSDIDASAIDQLRGELAPLPNVEFVVMPGVDPDRLGRQVDTVLMVNVLEHIEDDIAVLAACKRALASDGRVIVFVPAFPALYSRMDKEAGHFRRYRRVELRKAMEGAGFHVQQLRYFNAIGFAGWLVNKWLGSSLAGGATNAQINVFDRLVPIFRQIDRWAPFVGQSLVAVGGS